LPKYDYNAAIHVSKFVREQTTNMFDDVFNVPYCPWYAPIELLFRQIKKETRQQQSLTREGFIRNVFRAIEKIKPGSLRYAFREAYENMEADMQWRELSL